MVSLPTEFRTTVDNYSGPLDLLLFLIKKDEIDIFDIPLARVIEQYQLFLSIMRDLDPNACGEFLVMAANLMEIKSKLLLPREELEEEEDLEDPRMELVRQLLEYKKFKERAMLLERQLESHQKRYRRPPPTIPKATEDLTAPLPMGNIDVWDLLTAFHRIQIALGKRGPVSVVAENRPVGDFMREVRELLGGRQHRTAPFEELFQGARNRAEAIGYFLAILELAKEYELTVAQDSTSEMIFVTLRSEEETARLIAEEAADSGGDEAETVEEALLGGEGQEAAVEDDFDEEDEEDDDLDIPEVPPIPGEEPAEAGSSEEEPAEANPHA